MGQRIITGLYGNDFGGFVEYLMFDGLGWDGQKWRQVTMEANYGGTTIHGME